MSFGFEPPNPGPPKRQLVVPYTRSRAVGRFSNAVVLTFTGNLDRVAMPIRTLPIETISADHVNEMRSRGIRESHNIDFKLELNLGTRDEKSELLKDIVAFANGNGGTLLYGVREGTGDLEGVVTETPGIRMEPDAIHRTIENLLRDSVDERIYGVLHRAVPGDDNRFYYIIHCGPMPLSWALAFWTMSPRILSGARVARYSAVAAPKSWR